MALVGLIFVCAINIDGFGQFSEYNAWMYTHFNFHASYVIWVMHCTACVSHKTYPARKTRGRWVPISKPCQWRWARPSPAWRSLRTECPVLTLHGDRKSSTPRCWTYSRNIQHSHWMTRYASSVIYKNKAQHACTKLRHIPKIPADFIG